MLSLKNLTQKRRVFRKVQANYVRIKKTFIKVIQPMDEPSSDKTESTVTVDPTEIEKKKVNATHRLLRNFNFAVNV